MFDDWSLPLRFFIAFIVVLALIGLTAWLVRRFSGDRLGSSTARGRQPRLAVIDAAAVDGRRRLILIRRDNVEHLLMIGGPSDVVVEANIVRAVAAQREASPPARAGQSPMPASADTLPRPVPLSEGSMWPLQPEAAPVTPPAPAPRPQRPPPPPPPAVEEPAVQWHAEPERPAPAPAPRQRPPVEARQPQSAESRPAIDPLAGLAAELARSPELARPGDDPVSPPPAPPRPPIRRERPTAREPVRDQEIAREQKPAADPQFSAAADQNLADMAHRLEAALRRPSNKIEPLTPAEPAMKAAPPAEPPQEEPTAPPEQSARGAAASSQASKSATGETKPGKSLYDSLEQEMASLLGPRKT